MAQLRAAFAQCLRAVVSRHRAGAIFEDTDTSPLTDHLGNAFTPVTYTGTWTQVTPSYDLNTGDSYHETDDTGTPATVAIETPSDYDGQPIALQFIGAANGSAAGATATVDGGGSGVIDTVDIGANASNDAPVCYRITGLLPGTNTVTVTLDTVEASGSLRFDSWHIEAVPAQPIVVCNVAKPFGYPATYPAAVSDDDVDALNDVIASVIAEFDDDVQLADLDAALEHDLANFAGTATTIDVHPNDAGHARCADAINLALIHGEDHWSTQALSAYDYRSLSPDYPWSGIRPELANAVVSIAANLGIWQRVHGSGRLGGMAVHIGTFSGAMCLAVYSNSYHGRFSAPGALRATTGSFTPTGSVPAMHAQAFSPNTPIWVNDGDWFFVWVDNTSMTLLAQTTSVRNTNIGLGSAFQASGLTGSPPSPPVPPTITPREGGSICVIGTEG